MVRSLQCLGPGQLAHPFDLSHARNDREQLIPSLPPLRFVDQRLLCGALCLLGVVSACGGAATQQTPVHRPGPDLSGYYATRTPGDLAYGRPQGLESETSRELANLDEYLKPPANKPATPARTPSRHAASAQLAMATPVAPVQALPQQTAPVQSAAPIEVASASTELDAQRYASRESQAKKNKEQYRGGDVLVISATTLVIVLLIVLIIVLLT